MRFSLQLIITLLVILTAGCGSSRIGSLNHEATEAFKNKEFERALGLYEEIIDSREASGKAASGLVYQQAGLCAWEVNDVQKAIAYLRKASQTDAADEHTLFTLAQAYQKIDNLSLELWALRTYVERYPAGKLSLSINKQLFHALVNSNNWDAAMEQWERVDDDSKQELETLTAYLIVLRRTDHNDQLTVAQKLHRMDSKNIEALDMLADWHYRTAEKLYQDEMKAYNNNRTNAQYRKLLRALEDVNKNFRTSRDYYESLFKINPRPRYAFYLGNIYTRFENKERADFYYERAKGD